MPGRSKTWVGRSPPPEEPSPKFQEKALTAPSASVEPEPSKRTVWLVQAVIGSPASEIGASRTTAATRSLWMPIGRPNSSRTVRTTV